MRRTCSMALILVSAAAVILSCASGGRTVPEWVLQRPSATSTTEYFVVSGFDPNGNETAARDAAATTLLNEINQYLGVDVSVISQGEERGSLDTYEVELRTSVTVEGAGRIAGMRIDDTYVVASSDGVSVYVLASYDKAALEQERRTREALVAEREDAVSAPEARALAAMRSGDVAGALAGYSNASAAALGSDIRNADVKFERNIRALSDIIQGLAIEVIGVPEEPAAGRPMADPFTVRVIYDGRPAADIDLRVSYSEAQRGGRTRIQSIAVKTDSDGTAVITLPPPTIVGDQLLTVQVDLSAFIDPLDEVPREYRGLSDQLFENASSKFVRIPYRVVSLAREIPMGIFVIDFDEAGSPAARNTTAGGVSQTLTQAGFRLTQLDLAADFPDGAAGSAVIELLDNRGIGGAERIIIGTASVLSVDERDGFIVRVGGSIEVWDRGTGELVFAQDGTKLAQSSTRERATASAFGALGQDFADEMIRSLP